MPRLLKNCPPCDGLGCDNDGYLYAVNTAATTEADWHVGNFCHECHRKMRERGGLVYNRQGPLTVGTGPDHGQTWDTDVVIGDA